MNKNIIFKWDKRINKKYLNKIESEQRVLLECLSEKINRELLNSAHIEIK